MGTPPQRTLSRSLLEELLSAEVDEVLQEHDRPTSSKPSSSNSGESKMEAEEERAGDTAASMQNQPEKDSNGGSSSSVYDRLGNPASFTGVHKHRHSPNDSTGAFPDNR